MFLRPRGAVADVAPASPKGRPRTRRRHSARGGRCHDQVDVRGLASIRICVGTNGREPHATVVAGDRDRPDPRYSRRRRRRIIKARRIRVIRDNGGPRQGTSVVVEDLCSEFDPCARLFRTRDDDGRQRCRRGWRHSSNHPRQRGDLCVRRPPGLVGVAVVARTPENCINS